MTADASTEKVLDTIAKLLAVSEGRGATEAEAELANAHVERLLAQHNLTLSQVESRAGTSQDGKRRKDEITVVTWSIMQWQTDLLEGIAESNFCLARAQWYWDERGQKRKRVVLIGREVNVVATTMMYGYLKEACFREMADHGYAKMEKGHYARDGAYFCHGMTSRVVERLRQRRKEREDESARRAASAQGNGTHRELVLSDVYGSEADLNNDFLNGFPAGTTAAKRREEAEREARFEAEFERLKGEGVDWVEAWYRSRGYSQDLAVQYAAIYKGAGGRAGRGRRRGGRGGSAHNWSRRDEAEYRKVNSASYRQGLEAGASISLDDQVGGSSRKSLPSK